MTQFSAEEIAEGVRLLKTLTSGGYTPESALINLERIEGPDLAAAAMKHFQREAKGYIELRRPDGLIGKNRPAPWYCGPDFHGAWCWPAYKALLEAKGWTDEIGPMDEATSKILGLMEPPSRPKFATRGLVVGYVQSGKTANFTGLIAKAVDVGYKLVIVLAGMTSSLRQQTQKRLEKELRSASNVTAQNWHLLTEAHQDFRANGNPNALLTPSHGGMRILCVVKKNTTVLRNLLNFLKDADRDILLSCPTLIIDDEADQASINTRKKADERSAINRRIVDILNVLPKCAYVGYTATPFANLFVDPNLPEDIYPRDFVFSLPLPPKYFGPERIFGRAALHHEASEEVDDGIDVIRDIPEGEIPLVRCARASERFDFVPEMANSLRDAVNYFLLATAVRLARGHQAHSSMLVHTTLYVAVHDKLKNMLDKFVDSLRTRLKADSGVVEAEFHDLWRAEYGRVEVPDVEDVSFDQMWESLPEVLRRVEVVVDNGRLGGLNYAMNDKGEHKLVIAVGGNTLSRGLTLEDLIVSYFVRPANAYDTLLQMGRWFGYRVGYEDLPRVWMTSDLVKDFFHLATVEEEIRQDMVRYDREQLTPLDFGVRVQTHPALAITSSLKMQNVRTTSASYSGKHLQTFLFKHDDAGWLNHNIEAVETLLSSRVSDNENGGNVLYLNVSVEEVLAFLRDYNVHPDHADLRYDLLEKYILKENEKDGLKHWNVCLYGNQRTTRDFQVANKTVQLVNRSRYGNSTPANIKALTSARDRVADCDRMPNAFTLENIVHLRQEEHPYKGLLMLYPIDKDSKPLESKADKRGVTRQSLDAKAHVLGLGLMFPPSLFDHKEYLTNDFKFLSDGDGLAEEMEGEDEETFYNDEQSEVDG